MRAPPQAPRREMTPFPYRTLMVQGTTSDAGKSTVVAALCRLLKQRGVRVAPSSRPDGPRHCTRCTVATPPRLEGRVRVMRDMALVTRQFMTRPGAISFGATTSNVATVIATIM